MRDVATLQRIARELRMDIVEMIYRAASGHPGGSLSIVELLTTLYFDEMKQSPENRDDPERDRFVLSKGHTGPGPNAPWKGRSRARPFRPFQGAFGPGPVCSPLQGGIFQTRRAVVPAPDRRHAAGTSR